jgi:metal-sulfur cluster biosynthetic enzyme
MSEAVLAALGTVRDPELDTSIVELGFVSACSLDADGTARVRLRLPTYFCAPNFAFLMVADAYDAVAHVDGVSAVDLALDDHFAAGEINAGVAAHAGFAASFDGLAAGELDDLRRDFLRKAMLAAQDRVVRPLIAAGVRPEELATWSLGQVPPSADLDRLRARRVELGVAASDGDPLLVHVDGTGVDRDGVRVHLHRARTVRVSIDANGDYCRQLLAERYGNVGASERRGSADSDRCVPKSARSGHSSSTVPSESTI